MGDDITLYEQSNSAWDMLASKFRQAHFDNEKELEATRPLFDRFVTFLSDEPAPVVLDAGCGPGQHVKLFLDQGIETVGVDLSRVMIEEEARRLVPEGVFRRMDLRRLNYPPDTFAGIWAIGSLHFLPKGYAIEALREFARVLKPGRIKPDGIKPEGKKTGGILCVVVEKGEGTYPETNGRWRRYYSSAELRQELSEAGFEFLEDSPEKTVGGTCDPKTRQWLRFLAWKPPLPGGSVDSPPCYLCSPQRYTVNLAHELPGASAILAGGDDLFLMPDVAPLVEGHLLLCTTQHHSCFGAYPKLQGPALPAAIEKVRRLLREAYGKPVLLFEHGAVHPREAGGCVDHAHFHFLPFADPVRASVAQILGDGEPIAIEGLRKYQDAGTSYVYLDDESGQGRVYKAGVLPCQFLRQIVAKHQGCPTGRWQEVIKRSEVRTAFRNTCDRLFPIADRIWPPGTRLDEEGGT